MCEALLLPVCAGDMSGDVCRTCHLKTIEHVFLKQYVHPPFNEGQCTACHLAKDDSVQHESTADSNTIPEVSWIGTYSSPDSLHQVTFSQLDAGCTLLIEVNRPQLPAFKMFAKVPQQSKIPHVAADNHPPVLSDIAVKEVKRTVLISAVISWKTDEPASSTVHYSNGKQQDMIHEENHFSKNHEMLISALQANTTYTFEVISEDVAGNVTRSQPYTFSTERFFSTAKGQLAAESAELSITNEFFKIDNNTLMLELTANTPVSISIGYYSTGQMAASSFSIPDEHVRLSRKEWITISSCHTCHEGVKGPMTHPVNVHPPAGMVIPPEYPTLPNGRISCMSCHVNHGANIENRLLKSSKRQLCVGCHRDMA